MSDSTMSAMLSGEKKNLSRQYLCLSLNYANIFPDLTLNPGHLLLWRYYKIAKCIHVLYSESIQGLNVMLLMGRHQKQIIIQYHWVWFIHRKINVSQGPATRGTITGVILDHHGKFKTKIL